MNHGRIDLVVMENLFYDRKVDKTFDLKGIQGRKVKPTANDSLDGRRRQTLFDGEWIEGTGDLMFFFSRFVIDVDIRAAKDADARSSRVEKGFEGSREERCGFLGQDEHYGLLVGFLVLVSYACSSRCSTQALAWN